MALIKINFSSSVSKGCTFFMYMEEQIVMLRQMGRVRGSEIYSATLNSFRRFRNGRDISMSKIDSNMMVSYESYLKMNGIVPNSTSFYMRCIRAVYNRAVENGLTEQRHPFRHVYTGVDKTVKRAVPVKTIKEIKNMDLSDSKWMDFARDMFMFSFYTRGMSIVDMAYLRKSDLNCGILTYRRRKTGQQLFIKWEPCMREIVNKYNIRNSPYLLPLIKEPGANERRQYLYSSHNINRFLKLIGERLNLSAPLTMYVARHSWASIARSKKIAISVISEGMGHDSEKTTQIYLSSLDSVEVDKANKLILKSLL